jgi:hypothetical protein
LAVLAVCVGAQNASAAVVWAGNGHEYEVVRSEGINWSVAQAESNALGSGWHLATITSAEEAAFVESLLPGSVGDRSHFWLGGTDAAGEGAWAWATGEAWSYVDWWPFEPNNGGAHATVRDEDYLALDLRSGNWNWNDAPDNLDQAYSHSFTRGYVIERVVPEPGPSRPEPGPSVPEPGTLALLGLGLAGLAASRRRAGPCSMPDADLAEVRTPLE